VNDAETSEGLEETRESEFTFGTATRPGIGVVHIVLREIGTHNLEDARSLLAALDAVGIPESPGPLFIDVRATFLGPSREARVLYKATVFQDYTTCIASSRTPYRNG
jgi:hypothetical protein